MTDRARIVARPWTRAAAPGRVLAIRLQAMGDVVITLPYLTALRRKLPKTEVDLLTREETAEIPRSLQTFSRVFAIGGGRHFKKQCLSTLGLLPRLVARRYDVVIDLQNNEISRFVVAATRPRGVASTEEARSRPESVRARRSTPPGSVRWSSIHVSSFRATDESSCSSSKRAIGAGRSSSF